MHPQHEDNAARLTVSQAARKLGLSAERVRQLIARGRLEADITPLGRLIPIASVLRLLEQREQLNPHPSGGDA